MLLFHQCAEKAFKSKQIGKSPKSSHPYGLTETTSAGDLKQETSHPYGLKSTKEAKRKASSHPYNLRSTSKANQRSVLSGPYGFKNEGKVSAKDRATNNHPYGLSSSPEDKKLSHSTHPYGLKGSKRKGDKNPYGLKSTYKEKHLTKRSKHPYRLRVIPKDYRQDVIKKPFFDLKDTEDVEVPRLTAYISNAPGVVIPDDDFLPFFGPYKKPVIRAYLIGNQDYQDKKYQLKYVKNDIKVFRELLKQVLDVPSSHIHTIENAKLNDFVSHFKDFVKKIEKDELVIIYYSGHSDNNGMPIFTDMQTISPNYFHNILLKSFKNDTALIMDSAYKSSPGASEKKSIFIVEPEIGRKRNFIRFYNLNYNTKKEGYYKNDLSYKRLLKRTYSMLDQMGVEGDGNGLFTLIFLSFFADFFSFDEYESEASFETVNSYIQSKISSFEEAGVVLNRPKKYPIVGSRFLVDANNFLLFKNLAEARLGLSDEDRFLKEMYKKAVRLQNEGKYDSAANLFLSVLRKRKGANFANTKARLAECYLELGDQQKDDPDKSIRAYKRALRYDPDSADALYNLGKAYEKKGDNDKAAGYYKKAAGLGVNPELTRKSKRKLSKLERKKGLLRSAKENMRLGYIAYQKKDYEKAIRHFKKAEKAYRILKDSLRLSIALNNLGTCYIAQEKYDRAFKYSKKSLKLKKKLGDAEGIANSNNNLGVIYYHRGKYRKAVKYLLKAQKTYDAMNRRDAIVATCLLNLANSYQKLGEIDEALTYLREGVEMLKEIKDSRYKEQEKRLEEMEKS